MSKKIELDQIGLELNNILNDYSASVLENVNQATQEYGVELKDLVKAKAPVLTGKYKKAISVRYEKGVTGGATSEVYVKSPHYRLAHLLENSHALRGGGRSKAQPHFKPAMDAIEPKYLNKIKKVIEDT